MEKYNFLYSGKVLELESLDDVTLPGSDLIASQPSDLVEGEGDSVGNPEYSEPVQNKESDIVEEYASDDFNNGKTLEDFTLMIKSIDTSKRNPTFTTMERVGEGWQFCDDLDVEFINEWHFNSDHDYERMQSEEMNQVKYLKFKENKNNIIHVWVGWK